ncbi:MAG: AAA-like domain-containing protein [Pseudomonadota bacterium]
MPNKKRIFETRGPVDPSRNYVVPRQTEIAELAERIKQGRYIVIFAPRQTGKTTFFRWTLDALSTEDNTYFPIQLDFQICQNLSTEAFYHYFYQNICKNIHHYFKKNKSVTPDTLSKFLENASITDHVSMVGFFEQISSYLKTQKLVIIIDEFDGIPTEAVSDFLYSLRHIYLSDISQRCPYSVGIVGVKSITQLNYDRSISPFNIQDEFILPNFTISQVRELFEQYTEETGQVVATDVIETLHRQTAGQPFLVNRLGQILTEEMDIPLTTTITHAHFEVAHRQILEESNVNIDHLVTNIQRNPRFESLLMKITSYDAGIRFNLRDKVISELVTYGVLKKSDDSLCEIANPIYQYCIMQTFQPTINGLEQNYLPQDGDTDFVDYLTPDKKINMRLLLANFHDFIARAGYRILQVPDTPQEFVGQYLLFGYLDAFVRQVHGFMYLEVRSGRGRIDLIILHQNAKYIVETKIWEGNKRYQTGKRQLAKYLKLEGIYEGYYVVFDHRAKPKAGQEAEMIEGLKIVSYTIPVVQEKPSNQ